jgi:predicted tellurium resistance membrane protein TerC
MSHSESDVLSRPAHGSDIRRKLWHYLVAFSIILEGVSRVDHAEGLWSFILLCWVAAIVIVAAASLHQRLKAHAPHLEALILVLEAVVSGSIGILALYEGKVALPYAWFAACLLSLSAMLMLLLRERAERQQASPSRTET